jgi:hypothetical protein
MLNKRLATGLLLGGLTFSVMGAGRAMAQSALAKQNTAQQSKTSTATSGTAKPAAKAATAPAKKSPPKPLVYVVDNRNVKSADASTSSKTDASPKPGTATVKKASATSTSKSANASASQNAVSADVTKAFQQNCPSVALTESKAKAEYDVTFDREPGSKGVKSAFGLRKASKIEVMSRSGKELFSENGHSTGQLVKDACTSMGTPSTKIAKK